MKPQTIRAESIMAKTILVVNPDIRHLFWGRVKSFQNVFDGSRRRIRGLWQRKGSFYVQAMVVDPETGIKKNTESG
jgi:hypothetical protein